MIDRSLSETHGGSKAEAAAPPLSAEHPDWSRERPRQFWDPARRLLGAIRRYQRHRGRQSVAAALLRLTATLEHRLWSFITQCEIPLNTRIGGGLAIPHPNGIVIHGNAEIGPNCLVFHQVTIGLTGRSQVAPRIGGQVDIGAGAKILGPVTVGDHAIIGANAVVTRDVPPHAVVGGIPARIIRMRTLSESVLEEG